MQRFPSLLSHPALVILPEDFGHPAAASWQEGNCGCGPFRVLRFEPGHHLVLGRNPYYWRAEEPRCETLTFHFGVSAEQSVDDLRAGRVSLVSAISPGDAEALHREPRFAEGHHQVPRLSTAFLVLNPASDAFADRGVRHAFITGLDLDAITATANRWTTPAQSLIPPGLLGRERAASSTFPLVTVGDLPPVPSSIRAAVSPPWSSDHRNMWNMIVNHCEGRGIAIETVACTADQILAKARSGELDLLALRWIASFPDPDSFAGALLHSTDGRFAGLLGDEALDRLIEHGRRETDPSLRQMIYLEIEERIAKEAWILPLVYEQSYRFCQPELRGLRFGLTIPEVFYAELSWG